MTRDELLKKICAWGTCDCGNDYESCNCDDCNRVLEEWLYDYEKQIRAEAINDYDNKLNEKINTDTRLKDTIRKILDNVAKEMYCKGIDDFLTDICKMIVQSESNGNYRFYACEIKQSIADLAKQLKAGRKE